MQDLSSRRRATRGHPLVSLAPCKNAIRFWGSSLDAPSSYASFKKDPTGLGVARCRLLTWLPFVPSQFGGPPTVECACPMMKRPFRTVLWFNSPSPATDSRTSFLEKRSAQGSPSSEEPPVGPVWLSGGSHCGRNTVGPRHSDASHGPR